MAKAKAKPAPRKLKKSTLKNQKRLAENNLILKKYTA